MADPASTEADFFPTPELRFVERTLVQSADPKDNRKVRILQQKWRYKFSMTDQVVPSEWRDVPLEAE